MVEQMTVHEIPIRLRMAEVDSLVLIQVEGANLTKGKSLLVMQAHQFLIHADRSRTGGQAKHGVGFGTDQFGDFAGHFFIGRFPGRMDVQRDAHVFVCLQSSPTDLNNQAGF